jgi:hypothetical protein
LKPEHYLVAFVLISHVFTRVLKAVVRKNFRVLEPFLALWNQQRLSYIQLVGDNVRGVNIDNHVFQVSLRKVAFVSVTTSKPLRLLYTFTILFGVFSLAYAVYRTTRPHTHLAYGSSWLLPCTVESSVNK